MLVVGGTYVEHCYEPNWLALYGSGLRAATLLASLVESCDYETCIGRDTEPQLSAHCASVNVNLRKVHEIPHTISFTYRHPLSVPIIRPERADIKPFEIHCKDEIILRFGMLEANPVTTSDTAVYDPQSIFNPKPFAVNGSSCKRLAIVTNAWEGHLLTRQNAPAEIAAELIKMEKAEAVVIKQGPFGCLVVSAKGMEEIPAFWTERVFSIGSGDVFAAAFANFWAVKGLQPGDAAEKASQVTAVYCETQQTSMRKVEEQIADRHPLLLDRRKVGTALIYLAGPFFTMAQRWIVGEAREALRSMKLRVFSPLHDVGIGTAKDVVPADIEALEKSTVVFALLDGMDPGTIFEIGYAVKRGIPVIGFVQNESEEHLKMLIGTGCAITSDFATAIYKTTWAALNL